MVMDSCDIAPIILVFHGYITDSGIARRIERFAFDGPQQAGLNNLAFVGHNRRRRGQLQRSCPHIALADR